MRGYCELDGRLVEAREEKRLIRELTEHVGRPSITQAILIKRAARLLIMLGQLERRMIESNDLGDLGGRQVCALHNALRLSLQAIGLEPSSTGRPGGKRTGDRMTHYIVAGGPFDRACRAFLGKNPGLLWGDRPIERNGGGGKRAKYICPEDGIAMWGRPGVQVLCGEHDTPVPMAELAPALADAAVAIAA